MIPLLPPVVQSASIPVPMVLTLYLGGDGTDAVSRHRLVQGFSELLDQADPLLRLDIAAAIGRLEGAIQRRPQDAPGLVIFTSLGQDGWVYAVPLPHALPTRIYVGPDPVVWPARGAWAGREAPDLLHLIARMDPTSWDRKSVLAPLPA